MDIKANAKKHWRSQILPELLYIDVPEWGNEEEGPARVFFRNKFNAEERIRITKALNENGDKGMLYEALIVASRHSDGSKLFAATDRRELMTSYDPEVMERVSLDMMALMRTPPSIEDARGN